jgi:surface polysaccharide O-acyltransferase-like enzyme
MPQEDKLHYIVFSRMNINTSQVISALRFPLIVGVVFIHSCIMPSDYPEDKLPFLTVIESLFSRILPRFCVPMFFLIAGYLFFIKCIKEPYSFFAQQYKKRFKSLVIPYLFWNAVVIIIFGALHRFVPNMINPEFENVSYF